MQLTVATTAEIAESAFNILAALPLYKQDMAIKITKFVMRIRFFFGKFFNDNFARDIAAIFAIFNFNKENRNQLFDLSLLLRICREFKRYFQ